MYPIGSYEFILNCKVNMSDNKVILSFDYELFFGDRSGTVIESLINPTRRLLDCMDGVGFKGNFFVDWLMLKYLKLEKDIKCQNDYTLIVEQLKDIVRRGHRIELHIHPHWVDAKYKGDGTWDFSNFEHYCLSSFPKEEITHFFIEGVQVLTSIARDVQPDYQIVAFRAGGWAVTPFEMLKEGMICTNIWIDSSVMEGIGVKTAYSECMFTDIRTPLKGYYRFDDDVRMTVPDGRFIEIPISACERKFAVKVISRLSRLFRLDFTPLTDGTHSRKADVPDKWFNPYGLGVFTFSNITPIEILVRQLCNNHMKYTCYIEHPKDFTEYSVRGIRALSKIRKSVLYSDILKHIG